MILAICPIKYLYLNIPIYGADKKIVVSILYCIHIQSQAVQFQKPTNQIPKTSFQTQPRPIRQWVPSNHNKRPGSMRLRVLQVSNDSLETAALQSVGLLFPAFFSFFSFSFLPFFRLDPGVEMQCTPQEQALHTYRKSSQVKSDNGGWFGNGDDAGAALENLSVYLRANPGVVV